MSDAVLEEIRQIIQRDVNGRGLAKDPRENLFTACAGDLNNACRSFVRKDLHVIIVTGFLIPDANAPETDGPIGAVFLAKTLRRLGAEVHVATDASCLPSLEVALRAAGLDEALWRGAFGAAQLRGAASQMDIESAVFRMKFTHLIALERPGPSHTMQSVARQPRTRPPPVQRFREEVPEGHWDQYHTMRGRTITESMYPAHEMFERSGFRQFQEPDAVTIGIGDGGNEIGMGKIPWEVIARNIPNGGLIACRVPTDYNIVCGVSNWGAYGLAAGVWHLRGMFFDEELFSADRERELWEKVLREAVLVDGVTGQRTLTVDGLAWEDYIRPLREIADVLRASSPR